MIQLAIFIILIWLLFAVLRNKKKSSMSDKNASKNFGKKIIACSVCNTHVDELDIVEKNNKFYCKDCL